MHHHVEAVGSDWRILTNDGQLYQWTYQPLILSGSLEQNATYRKHQLPYQVATVEWIIYFTSYFNQIKENKRIILSFIAKSLDI